MKFIADFHIHSKYSRATAANLDLENLYVSAQIKGISLIGTGDFTHPGWWNEIIEKLEPAESGLFRLKDAVAKRCDPFVPSSCRRPVRFMLVTEISNIYKKNNFTRKNHNLVFMPDQASADRFNQRLDKLGNIRSDGRPILGLDARNLLEIVLETHDQSFLVPAHIWTPWFSLLGSKSGFDAVEQCFEDLTNHIFALETGLSSDPAMNRRVSALDRYTLISNSDAHSPSKLGREANFFDTEMSYRAVYTALKTGDPKAFLGTIEFYPEEGKYHVDGHRKCGFSCRPDETRQLKGLCPQCGKPLTLGVLYRVDTLADRTGQEIPKEKVPFRSVIPLTELLAELLEVGPKSKKVAQAYSTLIQSYGSEFSILCDMDWDAIELRNIPLIGESIRRMRSGELYFDPGYDGVFGCVRIFSPQERRKLSGQRSLFCVPSEKPVLNRYIQPEKTRIVKPPDVQERPCLFNTVEVNGFRLNKEQRRVVSHGKGPLIISAGPGTGKTRTITCRMAAIIEKKKAPPENILAVTFTNQAAEEMRTRLKGMLQPDVNLPLVATFHAFCRSVLQEVYEDRFGAILEDHGRRAMIEDAVALAKTEGHSVSVPGDDLLNCIVLAKQQLLGPHDDLSQVVDKAVCSQVARVYEQYQCLLKIQDLYDFEDLIFRVVDLLQEDNSWRIALQRRYRYIFVDEFQDINMAQYRLLQNMAPPGSNICVIGDPDQAIYGFRGSDSRFFSQFGKDYTGVKSVSLKKNYRSTETILDVSFQVIDKGRKQPGVDRLRTHSGIIGKPVITIIASASERAEAVAIGRVIEQMVGGTSFQSVDFGKIESETPKKESGFNDFGVLCRTSQQARFISEKLTSFGIPCLLISKQAGHEGAVQKLISAFRVISGKGAYVDLNHLAGLSPAGVGRETISMFKQWAYARQLPLATAMRCAKRIPVAGMSSRRQFRLVALFDLLEKLGRETAEMEAASALGHIAANTLLATRIDRHTPQRLVDEALAYRLKSVPFTDIRALQQDADIFQAGVEKVAVMTLHASKGLEFSTVFIAGCEAGLIPYKRHDGQGQDTEEERRLFYVAITRARKQLFCTWARKRSIYGKTMERQRSPFLTGIEERLISNIAGQYPLKKSQQKQLSLF